MTPCRHTAQSGLCHACYEDLKSEIARDALERAAVLVFDEIIGGDRTDRVQLAREVAAHIRSLGLKL